MKEIAAIGVLYLTGVFISGTFDILEWWIIGKVIFAILCFLCLGAN